MSQLRNKPVASEPGAPLGPKGAADGPSPRRVFFFGSIVIVVFVALLLGGIRVFLFPIWEANSEGVRQVATAQAQLSAASTREALTPVAAPTVLTVAPALPTLAPTAALTQAPVTAPRVSISPTPFSVAAPTPAAAGTATPVVLPTVPPEQAAEIAAAYKKYFDVSGDALLNLDTTSLGDVAAGQELAGLQKDIEGDRAPGRALQTDVQHEAVVLKVDGDEADVADRFKDSSIYVDPISRTPLPGEIKPASPDVAPIASVVYHLQRIDGTWKVVSGQRLITPQGSQAKR